jgi:hypothetical protein
MYVKHRCLDALQHLEVLAQLGQSHASCVAMESWSQAMSQTVITIIRNVDTKSLHQELVRAPEAASDVSVCIRICRRVPDSCYAYWTIEKDHTGRRKPGISLPHAIWKLKQLSYPRLHNQDYLVLRSERFVHYKRTIEQYWPTRQEVSHLCTTVSWSTTRSTFNTDFDARQRKADPGR